MAAVVIHSDYENAFRFDEFTLQLNSGYSNCTDTRALGSLLEVLTALPETILCQQPRLPPQPAAACGTVLYKNHRKLTFPQAETLCAWQCWFAYMCT